jgi:hypothetical protein
MFPRAHPLDPLWEHSDPFLFFMGQQGKSRGPGFPVHCAILSRPALERLTPQEKSVVPGQGVLFRIASQKR